MARELVEVILPPGVEYKPPLAITDFIFAHAKQVTVRQHAYTVGARYVITPEDLQLPNFIYALEVVNRRFVDLIVQDDRREIIPSKSASLDEDVPKVIVGISSRKTFDLFSCVLLLSGKNEQLNLLLKLQSAK